jgi:formylglycine-generating enzyme required for sulfatase activity
MRALTLLALLALLAALLAACADEPEPDATPTEPAWLTDRPENAHGYADETLARFRKLVEGDGWRNAAWNAQGTLEAVHEKTGLEFVLIPGGEFVMGSPATETDRDDDETQHKVTVPAFLLCKTECTQEAWVRGGGTNCSHFKGEGFPVEMVSWGECREWCDKDGLRLPSEAEWEYACRAGSTDAWCFGRDRSELAKHAWFYRNSGLRLLPESTSWDMWKVRGEWGCRTHEVGEKRPNAWGLHDCHGNVLEWCQDWYEGSYDRTPKDGSASTVGGSGNRVYRGGGLDDDALRCRSAGRYVHSPDGRSSYLGFRPAADLPR